LTGEFNDEEQEVLKKFTKFLKPPKIYKFIPVYRKREYFWLWERYAERTIIRPQEEKYWQEIKSVMMPKFELLWLKHFPLIKNWQRYLEDHDFSSINKALLKVKIFFNGFFDESTTVQLGINYREDFPSGHTKKGFPGLVLLNLSLVEMSQSDKVISVLNHELSHLIEHSSSKNELLKNSFLRLIKPRKICQRNPSWRHLINESIITSIAGRNFSYLDKTLNLENDFDQNYWNNETSRQIFQVAYEISEKTKQYLKQEKEMDQEYMDYVAKAWIKKVT